MAFIRCLDNPTHVRKLPIKPFTAEAQTRLLPPVQHRKGRKGTTLKDKDGAATYAAVYFRQAVCDFSHLFLPETFCRSFIPREEMAASLAASPGEPVPRELPSSHRPIDFDYFRSY